jgi:hypothetical protein
VAAFLGRWWLRPILFAVVVFLAIVLLADGRNTMF